MGHVTPAVGLGGNAWSFLAAAGSLWAWVENNDGWSVMGLGNITNEISMRGIGKPV